MADRRMKQIFREAAEVARSVPPEFRQTAFDKAVDLLAADDAARRGADLPGGDRQTRVSMTGLSTPDALLDRYVEALAFAANRLGMESVSADQLAKIVNDNFGVPTRATMVSAALSGASSVVRTVRQGQKTLYRLRTQSPPVAKRPVQEPAARAKAKPKPAPARRRKRALSDNPVEILNDLVALGFFTTARTTTEVLLYLEKQGLRLTTQQIAPLLLSLIKQGLLARRKTGGRYAYWTDDSED